MHFAVEELDANKPPQFHNQSTICHLRIKFPFTGGITSGALGILRGINEHLSFNVIQQGMQTYYCILGLLKHDEVARLTKNTEVDPDVEKAEALIFEDLQQSWTLPLSWAASLVK